MAKMMFKARKKPVVIEYARWFKQGDHPLDDVRGEPGAMTEGTIVRRYRSVGISVMGACRHCGSSMYDHGWVDTLEGGHVVCPGDYVITGVKGETYPCKPDVFDATYDLIP